MTRRTVVLEIVKTDLKSEETIINPIRELAIRSGRCWDCLKFGFYVASDGEPCFVFLKGHKIYDAISACFESEEIVWDDYEDNIKEIAKYHPQFEFYYHVISDGVSCSDELIYAHGSDFVKRENKNLSPKQMWDYTSKGGR